MRQYGNNDETYVPGQQSTQFPNAPLGLIFYGDGGGAFIAADARNGKLLWHFNTGQSWKAGPMTYMIDGRQFIGMAAGSTIMAFALVPPPSPHPSRLRKNWLDCLGAIR